MYFKYLLIACCLLACKKSSKNPEPQPPTVPPLEIRAADASFLPEIRTFSIATKNRAGQPEDMLTTLKQEGFNTIRIRLWKDPSYAFSGMAAVKTFAAEVKAKGMKVWLTVHYSDTWADPGNQTKPAAWATAPFAALKDSVYEYTKKVMTEINPEYIQIGNEINGGLLWPEGKWDQPTQMKALLAEGCRAVREKSPQAKIIIHYAGFQNAAFFYAGLGSLDYDMIGLSYYPIWHGKNPDDLQAAITNLGNQFNKDVVIAETAYPFTLGWSDYTNNVIGQADQILPQFPATEQGQLDFLLKLKTIVTATPRGKGIAYWGGEFIAFKGNMSTNGSSWENQALWNFDFKAVPAISAFKP